MTSAIVLINARNSEVSVVAQQLIEIEGVTEVFSTAGRHDLVAIVRVATNDDLATAVSDRIRKIAGIVSTETLIASGCCRHGTLRPASPSGWIVNGAKSGARRSVRLNRTSAVAAASPRTVASGRSAGMRLAISGASRAFRHGRASSLRPSPAHGRAGIVRPPRGSPL